jgi:protein TonB
LHPWAAACVTKGMKLGVICFLWISFYGMAQTDTVRVIHIKKEKTTEERADSSEIFTIADEAAEFPGGISALVHYLGSRIRIESVSENCRGRINVRLKFTVEKDGSLSNISVQDRDSCFSGLQANTVQVLSSMPVWKPARHLGKTVRSYYTLPLRIRVN